MKKIKLSNIYLATAISLAGITGSAQVAQSSPANQTEQNTNRELKSTTAKQNTRKSAVNKTVGGLDLVHVFTRPSNPPYQYACQNGAKKHGHKTNFRKLSHQAKVKKRRNK